MPPEFIPDLIGDGHDDPVVGFPFFADLVVLAGSLNPIPSRTRPLNSPAPMILSLKAWKSRSLPGLPKTEILLDTMIEPKKPSRKREGFLRSCFTNIVAVIAREGGRSSSRRRLGVYWMPAFAGMTTQCVGL